MFGTGSADSPARPFKALFESDAFAGVLLIFVAMLAIVAANSPFSDSYHHFFHDPLKWTPIRQLDTLHLWINDALMAVFFFVIGLEVKREVLAGNLSDARARRLPILAAAAGMATPALIYFSIAGSEPNLARGWAIPTATDIAFAMGVIGLLGNRVPASLRLFLLTVAIVDDIGAIAVIAIFYTAQVSAYWLLAAVMIFVVMVAMNRYGVRRIWPFVLCAFALWYCILDSGIHATIAGVLAAFVIPMRGRDDYNMLENMEHALAGWSSHVIVPLFGFANAGVVLSGLRFENLTAPLPLAVGAGLFVGKQAGVFGSIFIADKLGFARRPENANWMQIWGTSVLCGIGFTMSLFIGALAFPRFPALVEEARLGVLTGSFISALTGYAILRWAERRRPLAREP